jgi:2-amino-4-hydroxy-6-hydroxymethyldihydropteridine diphosphokinase
VILLGLGANLTGPWGGPEDSLSRTLKELEKQEVKIAARSSFYVTSPFGVTGQPAFVNAVVAIRCISSPNRLLALCKALERSAGRVKTARWQPRPLDIDVLDYHSVVTPGWSRMTDAADARLVLPHPGIAERLFVLAPLGEIAPFWHHPVTGALPAAMIRRLGHRRAGAIVAKIP